MHNGGEQVSVFTEAYVSGDINIAKDYYNQKIKTGGIQFAAEKSGVNKWLQTPLEQKVIQKEKRGIWNVTFNGKNSYKIRKLDEDAVVNYDHGNNKYGAIHIQKHLKEGALGEITKIDLVNMGEVIRNGEFDINNGRNVYTLNKNGAEYKVITWSDESGNERFLTFYSDKGVGDEISSIINNPTQKSIIPQPKGKNNENSARDGDILTAEHDTAGTPRVDTDGIGRGESPQVLDYANLGGSKADDAGAIPRLGSDTIPDREIRGVPKIDENLDRLEPSNGNEPSISGDKSNDVVRTENADDIASAKNTNSNRVVFYKKGTDRNDKTHLQETLGERVKSNAKGFEDVPFAIAKDGKYYTITDMQTGMAVLPYGEHIKTKKEALAMLDDRLEKFGRAKFDDVVNKDRIENIDELLKTANEPRGTIEAKIAILKRKIEEEDNFFVKRDREEMNYFNEKYKDIVAQTGEPYTRDSIIDADKKIAEYTAQIQKLENDLKVLDETKPIEQETKEVFTQVKETVKKTRQRLSEVKNTKAESSWHDELYGIEKKADDINPEAIAEPDIVKQRDIELQTKYDELKSKANNPETKQELKTFEDKYVKEGRVVNEIEQAKGC
ncbi:MAG: hypothetical protein LBH45_00185 [Campylobacteraceae bacterium]|jgi:hypothetical protein|nr:hypothetical protein [Campylobacteraceae bacterium]